MFKQYIFLLILSLFSIQGFAAGCPDGSEPVRSISADGTYFVFECNGNDNLNLSSIDEEKYTSYPTFKTYASDQDFIKSSEQDKLTYINSKDNIKGRFLYDQEDVSGDYQVHVIYIIASDSIDKQFDVNGTIEKIIIRGNEHLKNKTKEKQFRLDLTKEGNLDVSFMRVAKTKNQINWSKDAAGFFASEAVRHGFYKPKKLYSIFYQDEYNYEWGQAGNAMLNSPSGDIEVVMGVTYLGRPGADVMDGFHPNEHELFHSLGFVQLCAPGAVIERNSPWGKNDHLGKQSPGYKNDVMSDGGADLYYMDLFVDKDRVEYYGHSNPECEMDLRKSAFLEPTEEDFQLQPRSPSCLLTRWQPQYNHQRSLDCLAKLDF